MGEKGLNKPVEKLRLVLLQGASNVKIYVCVVAVNIFRQILIVKTEKKLRVRILSINDVHLNN